MNVLGVLDRIGKRDEDRGRMIDEDKAKDVKWARGLCNENRRNGKNGVRKLEDWKVVFSWFIKTEINLKCK